MMETEKDLKEDPQKPAKSSAEHSTEKVDAKDQPALDLVFALFG